MDAISITVDFSLRAAKPTPLPYRVSPFLSLPHAWREGGKEKGICRFFVLLSSFSRRLKTAGYRNVTPSGLGRTLRVCFLKLCELRGLCVRILRRAIARLKKLSVASKLAPYCRSFFKFN